MSTHDRLDRQREVAREQAERQTALGQAEQRAAMDQSPTVPNRSFFAEYGDADLSPPVDSTTDDVINWVAAELSHHNLYGNITQAERERLKILNAPLAMQIKAEFPARTGTSSKCVGRYRRELFGGAPNAQREAEKPTMTPDMAREIDSAVGEEGVRTQMQSQSVNASAWKGITQIQSVAHTVGEHASSAADGIVDRASNFLFGDENS